MPTVFIIQESPTQDFSDAKRFGDIEIILLGPTRDLDRGSRVVRTVLAGKWKDGDYLLPNGSPTHILAAGAALSLMTPVTINLLLWDRRTLKYETKKIDL